MKLCQTCRWYKKFLNVRTKGRLLLICISHSFKPGFHIAVRCRKAAATISIYMETTSPGTQTVKFGLRGERVPAQKFLALFLSAQNSLIDQFLRRFSNQFAVLPAQFSKKGLQILLLPRTEQFQYNPCNSDLCMDGLMKQEKE